MAIQIKPLQQFFHTSSYGSIPLFVALTFQLSLWTKSDNILFQQHSVKTFKQYLCVIFYTLIEDFHRFPCWPTCTLEGRGDASLRSKRFCAV